MAAALSIVLVVGGCGPGYDRYESAEERASADMPKLPVEAYLFDARLRRSGKPTSFRLELYQTDSVVGLGGRAYLGKGALIGRLTADSLEVYFPASNEYLYEAIVNLLSSGACSLATTINFLDVVATLPDSLDPPLEYVVDADYSSDKRPEFSITFPECPWELHLVYDDQEPGWRLREIEFDNGRDITLKAERRTYRRRAEVRLSKFRVPHPPDAIRIIP